MNYNIMTQLNQSRFYCYHNPCDLEPELLEEVTASSSLLLTSNIFLIQIPVLENLLQCLLNLHLLVAKQISLIHSFLQVHINLVTSGEDMPDIDVLNKRLHGAAPLLHLLLGHAAGDFAGSAGDSGNKAVGEALVVVSIFDVLDDDGFLAGVTASKDDDYFSGFDDGHFEVSVCLYNSMWNANLAKVRMYITRAVIPKMSFMVQHMVGFEEDDREEDETLKKVPKNCSRMNLPILQQTNNRRTHAICSSLSSRLPSSRRERDDQTEIPPWSSLPGLTNACWRDDCGKRWKLRDIGAGRGRKCGRSIGYEHVILVNG
jgi:hypothetical protein